MQAAQTDGSGNVGTSAAVTFSVKSSAPVVTLTAPVDGAALGSATPTIRGAAGTAAGDVNQVSVKLYAGSTATGTPVQSLTSAVSAGAWSATAAALADGTYTAQATQSDTSGNVGTSAAATFTVDTKAPVVAVTGPAGGATVTASVLTVRGTAGTASGDVATVTLRIYTGASATGTPVRTASVPVSAGAWTTDQADLVNGTYTLQATQTDALGHIGTSAPVTVILASGFKVTSVSPTSVGQGALAKTLTVSGTGFTSGVSVSFSGLGITPTATTLTSSTSLAVTVDVGATAAAGVRDVVVAKSGERSATCTGCLTVKAGPKVTTLAPSTLGQTSLNEAVKVNGTGFVTGAVVTFSGTGVTDTLTTIGPSQLTLSVSVAANAALGARDVTVVQPDGGRTTCTGCFTVAIAPTITSVSPTTIARSTSITMTITGTEFVKGAVVTISGTKVTVGKTTWVSKTSMTVVLSANSTATTGLRSVTVTNPDSGAATKANSLTVT